MYGYVVRCVELLCVWLCGVLCQSVVCGVCMVICRKWCVLVCCVCVCVSQSDCVHTAFVYDVPLSSPPPQNINYKNKHQTSTTTKTATTIHHHQHHHQNITITISTSIPTTHSGSVIHGASGGRHIGDGGGIQRQHTFYARSVVWGTIRSG